MQQILSVFAGDDILVRSAEAGLLRRRVQDCLDERDDAVVVLDFAGINGVSHDYVDELLSPLFDVLGDTLPDRVLLDNCSASVLNDLKCVADLNRPVTLTAPEQTRHGRRVA